MATNRPTSGSPWWGLLKPLMERRFCPLSQIAFGRGSCGPRERAAREPTIQGTRCSKDRYTSSPKARMCKVT